MNKKEPPPRGPGRPATGQTPKRYFRMDDEDWSEVERAAQAGEQTVSEFIRETLLKAARRRT
jgi:uncharacterized protein (DUF1778 family)